MKSFLLCVLSSLCLLTVSPRPAQAGAATRPGLLDELQSTFIQVADRIRPGVVNVVCEGRVRETRRPGPPDRNPLEDFFPLPPRLQPERASGSGVVVRADGYILTNSHVVRGAETIKVFFDLNQDDQPEPVLAKLVAADPETDLAVIKVSRSGLKPLTLGDSDRVKVGQWVVAVGSPFGESGTVTFGNLSARGRRTPIGRDLSLYEYLQTDAAINPGNSGGPLCDLDGNVLGINTMILSRSGASEGIGFALTVNSVKEVLPFLLKGEKVPRGFLGVSYRPVDTEVAQALGLARALLVSDVSADGPAHTAGVQAGDLLLEMNGKKLTTSDAFRGEIIRLPPGAPVRLKALRETNGTMKAVDLNLTLGQRPVQTPAPAEEPAGPAEPNVNGASYGLTVENITPDTLKKVRLPEAPRPGALVTKVEQFSPAYEAGLAPGVIIAKVKVNQELWREVKSIDELSALTARPRPGDRILLFARVRDPRDGRFMAQYYALVAPGTKS